MKRLSIAFLVLALTYLLGFESGKGLPVNEQRTDIGDAFYNGQVLLPDYAHDDTLIVRDAVQLTYEIQFAATDGELSEVLHKFSTSK